MTKYIEMQPNIADIQKLQIAAEKRFLMWTDIAIEKGESVSADDIPTERAVKWATIIQTLNMMQVRERDTVITST